MPSPQEKSLSSPVPDRSEKPHWLKASSAALKIILHMMILNSEPKFYLYDILKLPVKSGAAKENLAAVHFKKACDYFTDTAQGLFELFYVRDKEKRETDFLILGDKKPWILAECRSSEKEPDTSLRYFSEAIRPAYTYQLIDEPDYRRDYRDGITVIGSGFKPCVSYLAGLLRYNEKSVISFSFKDGFFSAG